MGRTVAVYQPRYFPRLHYLARVCQSDAFVVFDTVEFSRRSRQHRTEIDFGSKKWLTIPVKHEGNETLIEDATIDMSGRWATKHPKTLRHKYGSEASIFDDVYADVRERDEPKLVDVTVPTLQILLSEFDVETEVVWASDIDVERDENPSRYLAQLVEAVDGDTYLCGERGYRNYLEESPFDARGIDVAIQDWAPTWDEGNVNALNVLFEASEPSRNLEPNDNSSALRIVTS